MPVTFAGEPAAHLREEIKRNELAAERIQQLALEQQFPLKVINEYWQEGFVTLSNAREKSVFVAGVLIAKSTDDIIGQFSYISDMFAPWFSIKLKGEA